MRAFLAGMAWRHPVAVAITQHATLSVTKAFQEPILASSLGQLATSFGGFFATCTAMYLCLAVSLWITLPMSALAGGIVSSFFVPVRMASVSH